MLAVAVFEALFNRHAFIILKSKRNTKFKFYKNKINYILHFSNGGCHYTNDQHDDKRRKGT